jgi:hypothetical protein
VCCHDQNAFHNAWRDATGPGPGILASPTFRYCSHSDGDPSIPVIERIGRTDNFVSKNTAYILEVQFMDVARARGRLILLRITRTNDDGKRVKLTSPLGNVCEYSLKRCSSVSVVNLV